MLVPISQVKFESVTRSVSVSKIGDPPIKMQGFYLITTMGLNIILFFIKSDSCCQYMFARSFCHFIHIIITASTTSISDF